MESTWTDAGAAHLALMEPLAGEGVRVGVLAVADSSDGVRVTYPGQPSGAPVTARTTVALTAEDEGRRVVLVFENGDPALPIITGLLQETPVVPPAQAPPREARLDGTWVHLEADKEIVLRCGKSSLTLRADGKIVVRGMEIVSRARGANKVKGATVRIN